MTTVTGWNNGLCQDYDAGLGRWFADRLGSRYELRKTFMTTQHTVESLLKRLKASLSPNKLDAEIEAEFIALQAKCDEKDAEIERLNRQCRLFDAAAFKARIEAKTLVDAAEAKIAAMESRQPVAYRTWFDADNGARWLFSLWPEEEKLDVTWEPLYLAPGAAPKGSEE